MTRSKFWLAVMALCACGLAGCGSARYEKVRLEGTFTIAGRPVNEGGITFSPLAGERGKGVYAPVLKGQYVAPDVPVGKVRVTFLALEPTGREVTIMGVTSPETRIIVPAEHRAGMDVEILPSDSKRDFAL